MIGEIWISLLMLLLITNSAVAFGYFVNLKTIKVNITKQLCDELDYAKKYNKTSPTFAQLNETKPILMKDNQKDNFTNPFDMVEDMFYLQGALCGI